MTGVDQQVLDVRVALEDAGWDALLDSAGNTDPFRRLDVLMLMVAHERRPVVTVATRDGQAVAAAPLALTTRRGLTVARTLGVPAGWFDAAPPVLDDAAAEGLLHECRRLPADILWLREVPADSPLAAAMHRLGPAPRTRPEYPTYRVTSEDMRVRARKRRAECRRSVRVFERDHHPLVFDVQHDWDLMQPALAECQQLHRRRWASDPRADDLVVTEWGQRIGDQSLELLGREDLVRLTTLRSEGALIAFALAVRCGTGGVGYRMAFDRDRAASGLGVAAFLASLEALFAEGVTTIDMGPGGDVLKRSFTAPVPLVSLQWPLSRRGAAYLAAARLAERLRRRSHEPGPPSAGGPGDTSAAQTA